MLRKSGNGRLIWRSSNSHTELSGKPVAIHPTMKTRTRLTSPTNLVACTLIVALGASIRFVGLIEVGTWGSDTIYYTNIAKSWADGHPILEIGPIHYQFRPVLFLADAVAIRLLGFTDYAIKALNATVDSATIALVFVNTGLISGRRLWPAASAALIYALLPIAIFMARREMPHALGSFLLSLALTFFLLHLHARGKHSRWGWAALAGATVAAAALTHPDLALAGFGLLLTLGLEAIAAGWRRTLPAAAAFVLPLGLLGLPILSQWSVLTAPVHRRMSETVKTSGYLHRLGTALWNSVLVDGSAPLLYLFLAVATGTGVWLLIRWRARSLDPTVLGLAAAIGVPLGYLAVYSLLFPHLWPRVFFPLSTIALVATIGGAGAIIDLWKPWACAVVLLALTPWLVAANFDQFGRMDSFGSQALRPYHGHRVPAPLLRLPDVERGRATLIREVYTKTWARRVYQKLRNRVGPHSRLLVASSLMYPYPGRRELQLGYYFGDNAVFIIDHDEPLETIIRNYSVKMVLLSTHDMDRRVLAMTSYTRYLGRGKWRPAVPLHLGASYGFAPGEYTPEHEYCFVKSWLENRGARRLAGRDLFNCGHGKTGPPHPAPVKLPRNVVLYQLRTAS